MQKQSLRVVLASEYPQVRHLLSRVIEQEGEVDVVGQAQDARQALTLTRNLRPDITVIDSYLPHNANLNNIPLSRIYGLDTAQAISQEVPDTRVILLSNLPADILPGGNLGVDNITFFSREKTGVNSPFKFKELYQGISSPGALVFADIGTKQRAVLQQKTTRMSDKIIFFGALGFALGWLITLTVFLAPVGVSLAVAGAATVLLGLLGKLTASIWRNKTESATKRG